MRQAPSTRCLALATLAALAPAAARPDTADASLSSARELCAMIDMAGFVTEPCAVSETALSVDTRIDTTADDAAAICAQLVSELANHDLAFAKGWTLTIRPPSGPTPLATCAL